MSRIGKLPIPIPDKVEIKIDGTLVRVKGPLGEMSQEINPLITVAVEDKQIVCSRANEAKQTRAFHGLYRALIGNMVTGVSTGFKRELDIVGVGYRAEEKGNAIEFNLGYSHPILFELPKGVKAEVVPKTNHIILSSHDKQLLGQVSANIRSLRPPEPYKGKGVRYTGENVRRKAGKTAGK